jgi:hypothetical protein
MNGSLGEEQPSQVVAGKMVISVHVFDKHVHVDACCRRVHSTLRSKGFEQLLQLLN